MATVTAAEFNQRPSQVKRAAEDEPVVITEHSRPSFVLLTYAEYQRLLRTPTDWAPIAHSAWVCALYLVPSLFAAYLVFLRRDVAGG